MRYLLAVLLPLFSLSSCNYSGNREQTTDPSPATYDLAHPQRFRVRESMQEISGLVFYGDEQHLVGENDEEGRLYLMDIRANERYQHWKFGKSGDYEDVVYTGKDWVVLKSNGTLFLVKGLFTDSTSSMPYDFPADQPGQHEFEAAYYDPRTNHIVVLCKNCIEDKHLQRASAYQFDMATLQYDKKPVYILDGKAVQAKVKENIKRIRPSAAAIHPIEKRLYILASVNHLLIIAGLDGKVQEVYPLRRTIYNQPEGLAFAPNGDMYISNESGQENSASIMKLVYKPIKR
ncbi:MAG TPA: SdiA-regulated domain-containing protein [Chitinophaga sp.]